MLDIISNVIASIQTLVEGGGMYVSFIFASGVLLWMFVFERIWFFSMVLPREIKRTLAAWNARSERKSWCSHQIRMAMISRLNGAMTGSFPLMQVLVPLAPLLGLIGTVSGMLEVFDSMAIRGSADARTMASGVSHAMICTLTGLAVSITGLYPVYYFRKRSERETELISDRLVY